MTTVLKALELKPGIDKNTTDYASEGRWIDCDKIRFRYGRPEKIGGWVRETLSHDVDPTKEVFTGVPRDIYSWTDLTSNKYLSVGTHKKVEMVLGNEVYDLTPIDRNRVLTNAITTVATETEVQITDTNHNLSVGDYVYVNSQGSAVDGITLSGEYTVTSVIDINNYKIDSGVAATGSTSGGGGTLDIDYLLPIGDQSNGNLTGFGGGTWNTPGQSGQGYNRPRDGIGGVDLRQWSFDNWGEDLIACVRGGKIYTWDATGGVGTRLVEISGAPSKNYFAMVAQPSRHLIAFGSEVYTTGTFDPLIIRWAEQESLTGWNITTTNSAGEYRLPKGNYIITAIQTRHDILIITDKDAYSMRYVGGSDVFVFEPVGSNVSASSQHCGVDIDGKVFWMGLDNFYMYDGAINTLPCSLAKYIFDQDGEGLIDSEQNEKTYCSSNKEFNEIIWLYQSVNSTNNEIDTYIIFNYLEGSWYYGKIDRTVWLDKKTFSNPYAISSEGRLFVHEEGKDADGSPLEAYITSSYFDIADGENMMFVDRIIPDLNLSPDRNVEITAYFKKYPNSKTFVKGPYSFNNSKNKISMRGRGRQMAIKFSSSATGSDFVVGKTRISLAPDGRR